MKRSEAVYLGVTQNGRPTRNDILYIVVVIKSCNLL